MNFPKPYILLDAGEGRKLESLGGVRVDRQATTAFWPKFLGPESWKAGLDAKHERSDKGGGHWKPISKNVPDTWWISHGGMCFKTKLTAFGHCGLFAEQAPQWAWISEQVKFASEKLGRPAEVLNLFAYTGGSSMAAALAGAKVTHVDAAKGVVDWARENSAFNKVPEGHLRFVVEDCLVFLKKEAKRGRQYDGVILDPPSFGRGPNGETFKIEDDIGPLLEAVSKILSKQTFLFHLSSHSPGFSPRVLAQLGESYLNSLSEPSLNWEGGEMVIPISQDLGAKPNRVLPTGVFSRWGQFKTERGFL